MYLGCSRHAGVLVESLRSIMDEVKECELIRDSSFQYSSSGISVKQINGHHSMVIDYSRLNRQTVKDKFPLSIIEDMSDRYSPIHTPMAHGIKHPI